MQSNKKDMKTVNYTVKKDILGKRNEKGFYRFNKDFIEGFFLNNKTMLEANIYAHRILANIGLSLKNEQFFNRNDNYQIKLSLFDEEFLTDKNTVVRFSMNSSEICKGTNYKALKSALDFLESYQRDWYTSINSKGEEVTTLGGLISNVTINKDSGNFQFYITSYWLEKLLHLTEYNNTYYKLVQEISSNKHMIFWYWLSILPEHGTQINFTKLNDRFNLEYKSARDMCKTFLKGIKTKFDQVAHVSFNYSYKGDIIFIAKYERSPDEFSLLNDVDQNTLEVLRKRYKISYIAKRHKLTEVEKSVLNQLLSLEPYIFLEAYQLFISECRATKTKATNYTNKAFIEKFQENIIKVYKTTTKGKHYPKSYPTIII